jgi:ferredoxin
MIITKPKSYKEVIKSLKKSDKIGIISCNACARMCNTGGEEVMEKLALKLKKDGYNIVDKDLIGIACDFDQLKKNNLHGNVNIILACDSGVYNIKKIFPKNKIIPGLITIGLGAYDHKGNMNIVRKF